MADFTNNPQGSLWHRWDPHIHTPGTIINDQYSGADPWDDFLVRIENSEPRIRALGITDYFTLASYEKILVFKQQGRLKDVDLIFANIELRFIVGTARGSAINGHLLISPETFHHIQEAKRFLNNLTFSNGLEKYYCHQSDLIKLGYDHNRSIQVDVSALQTGTGQFKVKPDQLLEELKLEWADKNILLAITVGSNDGTSGLSGDQSFAATRQTLERSADIIFSGQDNQRKFWLGKGVLALNDLVDTYNGRKPCIHGSDAHKNEDVGRPDQDRFTWMKGDVTFDSLRQICIEPEDRVYIGVNPPANGIDSNIFNEIDIEGATWLNPSHIALNSGLVAIIGARGSGKTALVDLIAVGGNIHYNQLAGNSFIMRAREYLGGVAVIARWKAGEEFRNEIRNLESNDLFDNPRVQYLSQQFVEKLCSAEGLTDQLMKEIERVIFMSHTSQERLGFVDFSDMLTSQASVFRLAKEDEQQNLVIISNEITIERIKRFALPSLKKARQDKMAIIATDKTNRSSLINPSQAQRTTELESVTHALDVVGGKLEKSKRKLKAFQLLKQHIETTRVTGFPAFIEKLKTSYPDTGFNATEWLQFTIKFEHDVENILSEGINIVRQVYQLLKDKQERYQHRN